MALIEIFQKTLANCDKNKYQLISSRVLVSLAIVLNEYEVATEKTNPDEAKEIGQRGAALANSVMDNTTEDFDRNSDILKEFNELFAIATDPALKTLLDRVANAWENAFFSRPVTSAAKAEILEARESPTTFFTKPTLEEKAEAEVKAATVLATKIAASHIACRAH